MGRIHLTRDLPGIRPADAEALWHDLSRWPSFQSGLGAAGKVEGPWPAVGASALWDTQARGRTVARVTALGPGGQVLAIEDARLTGTQTVVFTPTEAGTRVVLALDYRLKRGGILYDLAVMARRLREEAALTLARFAAELRAERDL